MSSVVEKEVTTNEIRGHIEKQLRQAGWSIYPAQAYQIVKFICRKQKTVKTIDV